jgi:hypothetical protein
MTWRAQLHYTYVVDDVASTGALHNVADDVASTSTLYIVVVNWQAQHMYTIRAPWISGPHLLDGRHGAHLVELQQDIPRAAVERRPRAGAYTGSLFSST